MIKCRKQLPFLYINVGIVYSILYMKGCSENFVSERVICILESEIRKYIPKNAF